MDYHRTVLENNYEYQQLKLRQDQLYQLAVRQYEINKYINNIINEVQYKYGEQHLYFKEMGRIFTELGKIE
jgi:hypothetical protein